MSIVRDELLSIYTNHGQLTPAIVLEEATAETHPLHDRFNWDDGDAADKYRLSQAGQLIRSVKVKVFSPDPEEVRAFIHIPSAHDHLEEGQPTGTYVPEEEVRTNPALTALALSQMEREWRLLRRRWAAHQAFWELVQAEAVAAESVVA